MLDDGVSESQFFYNTHLVRDGTLSIRYKKNTRMVREFKNGTFTVTLNGVVIHENEDITKDDW
jgi:hypothetical protein